MFILGSALVKVVELLVFNPSRNEKYFQGGLVYRTAGTDASKIVKFIDWQIDKLFLIFVSMFVMFILLFIISSRMSPIDKLSHLT